ncbi:MAG: hypothetical protein ACRERR_00515 [Moraxellaceae bacterium]
MSESLGLPAADNLWKAIDYEVTWLHARWLIYRQLFGTNAERVEILNRSAGTFAEMLQGILLDDVQLGLAKLGDPRTTHTKNGRLDNMTLDALAHEITSPTSLKTELDTKLITYKVACSKVKDRRNKRIAHFDLKTMLNPQDSFLLGPSRDEIEAALIELRSFMNCIELYFTGSRTAYDLITLKDDGDSLIFALSKGLRYQDLVKAGKIPTDDLRSSMRDPHT